MGRVLGFMVMRNEADRYLEASLSWLWSIVDALGVYDDQSTDRSVEIAQRYGSVAIRPDDQPSFMDHEGAFRGAAWQWFEKALRPDADDWVLSVDADEFLVGPGSVRRRLDETVATAVDSDAVAVSLAVPEVYSNLDGTFVRVDGYWDTIVGVRLYRYRPGGVFHDRALASGSAPSYATWQSTHRASGLWLMHYGYADPVDRQEKHQRYSGRSGHSGTHVESIVGSPTLKRWSGPVPPVYRGQLRRS